MSCGLFNRLMIRLWDRFLCSSGLPLSKDPRYFAPSTTTLFCSFWMLIISVTNTGTEQNRNRNNECRKVKQQTFYPKQEHRTKWHWDGFFPRGFRLSPLSFHQNTALIHSSVVEAMQFWQFTASLNKTLLALKAYLALAVLHI